MRLSDITEPIEKNAAISTTLKYMLPKLKGVFQREVASWSRMGRATAAGGKGTLRYGRPAVTGTFQAARRGWAAAITPYRAFSRMTLKGYDKARNVARFPNPAHTGRGQAVTRMGVKGELQHALGGWAPGSARAGSMMQSSQQTFIPTMRKQTVTRSQKAKHAVGRAGQFMTGWVPAITGIGAIGEVSKKRYPITSPYI